MGMSEARRREWGTAEFLKWEARQPARYELVDGQPRLMTGGTQAHNAIAINLTSALKTLLRGSGCRPGGSDLRIPTGTGNVRYPDALIDCGEFRRGEHDASEPTVVFEVLSRSTAWTDWHAKLHDYDMTLTIKQYVLVSQDEPRVVVWNRGEGERLVLDETITNLAASVGLHPVGLTLPLADIYDGLGFDGEGAGQES
jgi:Uma2 family endonuclease